MKEHLLDMRTCILAASRFVVLRVLTPLADHTEYRTSELIIDNDNYDVTSYNMEVSTAETEILVFQGMSQLRG
jgi:hypothetical protein